MPETVTLADAPRMLALARIVSVRVVGRQGSLAEGLAEDAYQALIVAIANGKAIRAPRAWLRTVIERACSRYPPERWTEVSLGVDELDRMAAPQNYGEGDFMSDLLDVGGGARPEQVRFLRVELPPHLKPRSRSVLELWLEGYELDAIALKLSLRREQADRSWRVILKKAISLLRRRVGGATRKVGEYQA